MTVAELLEIIAGALLLLGLGYFLVHLLWPYRPRPPEEIDPRRHAQTQTSGPVRVTVSALGRVEGRRIFGVPLAIRGIQALWIEVENGEDVPLFYLRAGTDPAWYSPYEAFWLTRFRAPRDANRRLADRFYDLEFKNPVPAGETRSGFVFTRLDEGTKAVDLDLVGLKTVLHSFTFSLDVPGFRADSAALDLNSIYAADELTHLETEEELRRALESLPPCTTDRTGEKQGDPLNLVLVGERADGVSAFARRGWHPTEQTYALAVLRTLRSFVFRSRYLYAPVSPLYAFGRRQDISGQKARSSVTLRNHARFWVTPLRYRGMPVWIGQISRDIGVRFLLGIPPTTHKIDPDVDEARDGLLQDIAYSQALVRFAYVKGVGAAPRERPRHNLTGDPYFTDGLRVVLFFARRPMTLDKIDYLAWEAHTELREAGAGPSSGLPGPKPA